MYVEKVFILVIMVQEMVEEGRQGQILSNYSEVFSPKERIGILVHVSGRASGVPNVKGKDKGLGKWGFVSGNTFIRKKEKAYVSWCFIQKQHSVNIC